MDPLEASGGGPVNHADFPFVDLAVGGVDRRNNPVSIHEVRSRVNGAGDSYITVHRFPDAFREHVQTTGSVRGWGGPSWADYLVFDIDGEPERLEETRRATTALAWLLMDSYGVGQNQLRTFFSGRKGFHVLVPTELLGPLVPSPQLAGLLKSLALEIASQAGVEVDTGIYDRTRLFRLPNTRHSGSGLYKVELTWDELVNLDAAAIQDLASSPRDFSWAPDHLEPLPALEALLERVAEREPTGRSNTPAPPGSGLPDDVGPLLDALDADCTHDAWLRVGMALHHADPDAGLEYWDRWSATAPARYPGPEEIRRRWESFDEERRTRAGGKVATIGTLRHMATERGYRPPPQSAAEPADDGDDQEPPTRKLPAPLGIAALMGVEEPEEEWLVEGHIPAGGNVLMAGYPKTYKTFVLLDLAVSLASGTPFLGKFRVPERRRAGVVLMEDQAHRVRWRLKRLCAGRGITLPELDGWLHFWFRPPLRLNDVTAVELADYAAELDLDFLGVDSWAYVASGDSNSADEVTPQLQALTLARTKRKGVTVQLTHHARKDWGKKDAGTRLTDEIRNSGAFGAWYDCGMVLSRKDETSPVTVRCELRDFATPEPFAFTVKDEDPAGPHNGGQSGGWLRLVVSDYRPEIVDRMAAVEKLVPAVRQFIEQNPGCSKRALRGGVTGKARDVDGALEKLERDGEVRVHEPEGTGKASRITLLGGAE